MNRHLKWLFAAAALIGVLGTVVNLAARDWIGVAMAFGLALVYGALALKPELLSETVRVPDRHSTKLSLQLGLAILVLFLLLSLI